MSLTDLTLAGAVRLLARPWGRAARPCGAWTARPGHIRGDNGPKFAAKAVRHWLGRVG
jgi:hypothetical protein